MKVEKISLEIAALKKQLKTKMPDIVKTKIEAKINRLEKELKGSTLTGVEFARNLLAGKKKVSAMSKIEFNDFVKLLSKKPEYDFLKYLTKQQIKDDLDRVAKPVGWRFRGRTNFATPSKTDVKLRRNVYYENRSNRSDVSRVVRLGKGGYIGKIIGHTESNKPVYLNKSNEKSKDFTKQDNIDAAAIFHLYLKDVTNPKIEKNIKEMRLFHETQAKVNKGTNVSKIVEERTKDFDDYSEKIKFIQDRYTVQFQYGKQQEVGAKIPEILSKYRKDNYVLVFQDYDIATSKNIYYYKVQGLTKNNAIALENDLKNLKILAIKTTKSKYRYEDGGMMAKGGSVDGSFIADYKMFEEHIKDGYGTIDYDYVEDTWNNISNIDFESVKEKVINRLKKNNMIKLAKGGMMAKGGSLQIEQVYKIPMSTAKKYEFDYSELLDSSNEYNFSNFDGNEDGDGKDYSWNFQRGDDFPESIIIKNSDMLNDIKVKDFLFNDLRVKLVSKKEKGGSLTGNQHKLDRNKNGKIDAEDLKMIRQNKMAKGGMIGGWE